MISLYYALQVICYVKEIFKINNQYPSLLQIVIKELTDLIEFKALQPEPLIQLFDEDFKLDEFIRAI
jgi:VanZ family protein